VRDNRKTKGKRDRMEPSTRKVDTRLGNWYNFLLNSSDSHMLRAIEAHESQRSESHFN